MKIPVTFIFGKDADPLYNMIGLQSDADSVEILEEGILDLTQVEAITDNAGTTMVYMKSSQVFNINTPYDDFLDIYLSIES